MLFSYLYLPVSSWGLHHEMAHFSGLKKLKAFVERKSYCQYNFQAKLEFWDFVKMGHIYDVIPTLQDLMFVMKGQLQFQVDILLRSVLIE